MTKQDFIVQRHEAQRSGSRFLLTWMVIFFAVLIGNLPVAKWVDQHHREDWLHVTYSYAFFSFLFANLFLVLWYTKRLARQSGLLCPRCGKLLTDVSGQIAVATGHCDLCGEKTFEE